MSERSVGRRDNECMEFSDFNGSRAWRLYISKILKVAFYLAAGILQTTFTCVSLHHFPFDNHMHFTVRAHILPLPFLLLY